MTQFYVIEIQKYKGQDGEADSFGHIVHYAYDEDANKARLKAESKYHEVLAAAAVSELPQHSATLLTSDGRLVASQSYNHPVEVEPEPTEETQETEEPT